MKRRYGFSRNRRTRLPALELVHGRILIRHPPSSALGVVVSGRSADAGRFAGKHGRAREDGSSRVRAAGRPGSCPGHLLHSRRVEVVGRPEAGNLDGVRRGRGRPGGGLKRTEIDAPPVWATELEPSPHEVQIRDQFIRMFHPGRPVLTEIVAASEDDNSDMKQLSILALKSLGDVSLLMPMLSRKGDPVTRKSRPGRDSVIHGARS